MDLAIAGDGEATLPALIEAVTRQLDDGRRTAYEARGRKLAQVQAGMLQQLRETAAIGWDASPITMGRLCAELWEQLRSEDWSLVGNGIGITWPQRLWDSDKRYRFNPRFPPPPPPPPSPPPISSPPYPATPLSSTPSNLYYVPGADRHHRRAAVSAMR